jgi:alkylation response protein AidB-like acyl-CoA dehydrogenase
MDLSLSDDEVMLRDSVRSFVQREATTETLVALASSEPGHLAEWLGPMADAGWLGALVPAEAGGSGASTMAAALICEELGRGPVPGPFLVSSVVATLLLRAAKPSPRRDDLLAAVATGDAVVVPVLARSGQDWTGLRAGSGLPLVRSGGEDGGLLTYTAPFVPYATSATHLLVPLAGGQDTDSVDLAVVPVGAAGFSARRLPGFLTGNDEVTFDGVRVGPGDVLRTSGAAAELDEALAQAYVLVAAYQVGGCGRTLERSIEYSNTRVQFGQPIGRFQRVQDHIVELLNAADAARWTLYDAIWRLDTGQPARASAHLAKAVASESYITCTDYAHKVHGGIGVDPTSGLTLYTQMARSLYDLLGAPRWHKRQMADALQWSTT